MPTSAKDIIGNMYGNFIMRDFTFISSGLLINISIFYSFDLSSSVDEIISNNVLLTILFVIILIISYFFGFISQEIFRILTLVKTSSEVPIIYKNKFNSSSNILLMADIDKHFGAPTVKRLERHIFVKQVGSAFGSSFIVVLFFIAIRIIKTCSCFDIGLFIFISVITIFCVIENRKKWESHNNALNDLANRIIQYKYLENILSIIEKDEKLNIKDNDDYKNLKILLYGE